MDDVKKAILEHLLSSETAPGEGVDAVVLMKDVGQIGGRLKRGPVEGSYQIRVGIADSRTKERVGDVDTIFTPDVVVSVQRAFEPSKIVTPEPPNGSKIFPRLR